MHPFEEVLMRKTVFFFTCLLFGCTAPEVGKPGADTNLPTRFIVLETCDQAIYYRGRYAKDTETGLCFFAVGSGHTFAVTHVPCENADPALRHKAQRSK